MAHSSARERVLLINPPFYTDRNFIDYPYFTGLGVMTNAAVLREAGLGVHVADAQAQPMSDAYPVDNEQLLIGVDTKRLLRAAGDKDYAHVVVGLNPYMQPGVRNAHIADFFTALKQRFAHAAITAADCFVGGMHYTEYHGETFLENYPQVDTLVKYECEALLAGLLQTHGGTRGVHCGAAQGNLDDLPFPAWDLISTRHYFSFLKRFFTSAARVRIFRDTGGILPAVTSRGCPHRCTFCTSNPGQNSPGFRPHSTDYLQEYFSTLKKRWRVAQVAILDECVNHDAGRFHEIIGIIQSLGMRCVIPNGLRADKLSKKTLKALMQVTDSIAVSAESADAAVLSKVIRKGLKIESVERVAAWCRELSLPLDIHYMIGYPGETIESMNTTLHHAVRMKEEFGALPLMQPFVPIPGAPAYVKCSEQGLLTDYDERKIYSYFNSVSPVRTSDFSPDDVSGMLKRFRKKIHTAEVRKVIINLTYRCTNNCRFCAIGDREKRHGDFARYRKYLNQFRDKGVEQLDLDGGEPTLYPHFFQIIRYAGKIGYTGITVTTNGRALADRGFASTFLLSGITGLLISLHGHEAKIHEYYTRSKGSYEETVRGIGHAVRLKPRGVTLAVNTMLTQKNAPYISDFMEFIHNLGVNKLNVQFLTPFGHGRDTPYRNIEQVCGYLSRAMEKWHEAMEIELVNTIPCQVADFFPEHEPETGKFSRVMVFADAPPMNLAEYLDQRRSKGPECAGCRFSILCAGFYEFGAGGAAKGSSG